MSAISTQKIIDLGIEKARMTLRQKSGGAHVVDFAARRKNLPQDDLVDPPIENDVSFWEATVDSEGLDMPPARARALLQKAPDLSHPLVGVLKNIAGK